MADFRRTRLMQDRYVADVGDFGKYALLRRLCDSKSSISIKLGIVWCRFPNEEHNNDGRHISYLYSPKFHGLDDNLLVGLRKIVETDQRLISSVSGTSILRRGTVFCDALISPPATDRLSRDVRIHYRSFWLESCHRLTRRCELVFFDPDNGLEVASIPKHHPKAGKYIYWDELTSFWRRGQALLIYHHLNRTTSAIRQIDRLTLDFLEKFEGAKTLPLVFRRGSSRVFWLVYSDNTVGHELESRAADLLNGGWSRHFRPFGWPGTNQRRTPTR